MQAIILSSTGRGNYTLGESIKSVGDELGFTTELINLESLNLPLYNPDKEAEGIPDQAQELTQKLINAKLIIALAPEYNGSLPPVFTNAICWVSRSGDDWRGSFNHKLGLVGTRSGGGGQKLITVLRTQLEHLGVMVHPRPIVVNSGKEFNPDSCKAILTDIKNLLS